MVVHPVKSSFPREPREHAKLALVPVAGGDINRTPLVVQRVLPVGVLLVPPLDDSQPHSGPLIHHADGKCVQLLFASLKIAMLFFEHMKKKKLKETQT